MSRNVKAGQATVTIKADDSGLQSGLRKAQQSLNRFGNEALKMAGQLGAIGGAITGPMALATNQFIKTGDQLDKMNKTTGASVESLSALGYAAGQSGSSLENVEQAFVTMNRQLEKANQGSKTAAASFEKLGLSVDDLNKMSPEKRFKAIAAELAKIDDKGKRTAVAMELFRGAGQGVSKMAVDLAANMQKAKDVGAVITTEQANQAAALVDAFDDLQKTAQAVAMQIGTALAPTLIKVVNLIQPLVLSIADFVENNRNLVVVLGGVGAGLTVVASGLAGIGLVAKMAASGIGALSTTIGVATKATGALIKPLATTNGLMAAKAKSSLGAALSLKTYTGAVVGATKASYAATKAFAAKLVALAPLVLKLAALYAAYKTVDYITGNAISKFPGLVKGYLDARDAVVESSKGVDRMNRSLKEMADNLDKNTEKTKAFMASFVAESGMEEALSWVEGDIAAHKKNIEELRKQLEKRPNDKALQQDLETQTQMLRVAQQRRAALNGMTEESAKQYQQNKEIIKQEKQMAAQEQRYEQEAQERVAQFIKMGRTSQDVLKDIHKAEEKLAVARAAGSEDLVKEIEKDLEIMRRAFGSLEVAEAKLPRVEIETEETPTVKAPEFEIPEIKIPDIEIPDFEDNRFDIAKELEKIEEERLRIAKEMSGIEMERKEVIHQELEKVEKPSTEAIGTTLGVGLAQLMGQQDKKVEHDQLKTQQDLLIEIRKQNTILEEMESSGGGLV